MSHPLRHAPHTTAQLGSHSPEPGIEEQLSALMDGDWDAQTLDALLHDLRHDPVCQRQWRCYHQISDLMGGHVHPDNPAVDLSGEDDFMRRFSARLDAEPVVVVPQVAKAQRRRQAAPLRRTRWAALSVAASLVVVSTSAWMVRQQSGSMGQGDLVAYQPPAATLPVAAAALAVASPDINAAAAQQARVANPYFVAHQALIGNPGFSGHPVILSGAEMRAGANLAQP